MNAHSRTATDIAAAILGKPRNAQTVRVVTTTYGDMGPRFIVLVTPAGAERGEYYTVMNRRTLDLLREGRFSPEELELEIAEGVS